MNHDTTRPSRVRAVAITLTLITTLLALANCTFDDPGAASRTTMAKVKRHDPTGDDLAQLKTQVLAMRHVTDVELTFSPGRLGQEPSWDGLVTVDTTDHDLQVQTLRDVLALLWHTAELTSAGGYGIVVENSATSGVNASDLGYSGSLLNPDMEELFGPRPTPTT